MTQEGKISIVRNLIDDVQVTDEQVETYLTVAAQRILDAAYPCGTNRVEVPDRYGLLQCELAVRMIARRGGEGEESHTENGITRKYSSVDDADLLNRVVPCAGFPRMEVGDA